MSDIRVIRLDEKLSRFSEHWSPKIIGQINEMEIKLAKLKGEFIWHHHDEEDELFFVISGRLTMRLRDGDLTINPGELVIIPHGVEHMPVAEEEVHVMLIERAGTLNTGDVQNERSRPTLDRI
jgi:mannose-6-phosphate isomerase-like protein (cupin superfamily)